MRTFEMFPLYRSTAGIKPRTAAAALRHLDGDSVASTDQISEAVRSLARNSGGGALPLAGRAQFLRFVGHTPGPRRCE